MAACARAGRWPFRLAMTAHVPNAPTPDAAAAPPGDTERVSRAELDHVARALGLSGSGAGTARLLGVLTDPGSDLSDVVQALHTEPTLTARVLKVVNSPFYRRSGAIVTVEAAVALLGLDAVRGICAACTMDRLPIGAAGRGLDPLRFRLHSLAVAVAAQALAREQAPDRQGEAFIAGLLHDLGLLHLRPQAMAELLSHPQADRDGSTGRERERFGIDHGDAAAHLITAWRLPGWLADAVRRHHDGNPADAMTAWLQGAERLASDEGFGLAPASASNAAGAPESAPVDGLSAERRAGLRSELHDRVAVLAAP
jgi:HD-like signal output (HDOD) protein